VVVPAELEVADAGELGVVAVLDVDVGWLPVDPVVVGVTSAVLDGAVWVVVGTGAVGAFAGTTGRAPPECPTATATMSTATAAVPTALPAMTT
jgi:hypothetical protein